MITVDLLKLNKFKEVSIPSPAELFARFGFNSKKGSYSGDDKVPTSQSKVEACKEVEKLAIDDNKD